jgi:hypothetical protein
MDNNIQNSLSSINKLYDKQTYLDMYGATVVMFIFLTLFVFFLYTYFQVMQKRQDIVDDWAVQRCNPKYIPFAGYITHPEGKTAFEYTGENFQYCVQNILVNITGGVVNPIQYVIGSLTFIFKMIQEAIQQIRQIMSVIRTRIAKFSDDILKRVLNLMIPLQTLFISLMDAFNKIQGVMTASLYTMLGSYLTLKSLMGSIVELIIKLLIVLSIIIVGLWATPFTMPAAAAGTAVFLSISIPMALIIYFMTEVLHVKTSSLPKLRRCFDRRTSIKMYDGTTKEIQFIEPGELLANGIMVTAKFKVDASHLKMYNLKGVIVSETHVVKYNNKWIQTSEHPQAVILTDLYTEPFLYCLNTSNKEITINDVVFTDWDEIYGEELENVSNYINTLNHVYQSETINRENIENKANKLANIHRYVDTGFEKDTIVYLFDNTKKSICDIKIGDKLSTKGIVYGIVEIETGELFNVNNHFNLGTKKLYHLLITNKYFEINGKIIRDYNDNIDLFAVQ